MLKIESARGVLKPLFRSILRTIFREERERWYSRPGQTLYVLWGLMGGRDRDGSVRLRYAIHAYSGAQELHPRSVPNPPPSPVREKTEEAEQARTLPPERPRLSEGEFRALVRDVSAAMDRRARLETLREGGW